jgi:hypothetical protein
VVLILKLKQIKLIESGLILFLSYSSGGFCYCRVKNENLYILFLFHMVSLGPNSVLN